MSFNLVATTCPICAHTLATPFFNGGMQPLATLGWPQSEHAAHSMERFPHDFVQCPACTHVWNRSFCYDAIPYANNPNRMFNSGTIWRGHLAQTRELVLQRLPQSPTIIDIGCGEGHFVRGLAHARRQQGRFIGFDPNTTAEAGQGVEFHPRLFEPLTDFPAFQPDAVVIRHVLEHLIDPAVLIDSLAWAAAAQRKTCWLFAEMPCIDRVFDSKRIADFFYEHVAHFTTRSFRTLLQRAGEIELIDTGYDGEVVFGLVKLNVPESMRATAKAAKLFSQSSDVARKAIRSQLEEMSIKHSRVAIWGGTGKAAAFIHQFGLDAERFPLVVDSDRAKIGTYVPGSGQEIQSINALRGGPIDVVIIPTQWRARDIVAEMQREGIVAETVLIEHGGLLVDYFHAEHPYREPHSEVRYGKAS